MSINTTTAPSRLPRPTLLTASLSLIFAAIALGLSGCGDKEGAQNSAATNAATAAADAQAPLDPMEVVVPQSMASNFQVAPVGMAELAAVQEVAGRIEANERGVVRIGASVTGRITDVLADIGDRVVPGKVLARVASPELTTAQLAYMRASATSSLAERAVDRARQLLAADVIGTAESQRRETEAHIAKAEMRAAADQLQMMGVSHEALEKLRTQGSLSHHAAIAATSHGVVIERKISQGQVAQPGDPLFTVADLSSVWVAGDIPEQMARNVALGQSVQIEVPALGLESEGARLSGKVIFVGDTVSADTRTVMIRTQVDNKSGALKPQMLATMKIQVPVQQQLAIPAAAVIRENDRDHVYVKKAQNHYRLTPVTLGAVAGDYRPVISGVAAGSEIVVQGAFHLNNERKRAELE
jgi:cobalt-zinc-cadmium efflux system membrane fusion protein